MDVVSLFKLESNVRSLSRCEVERGKYLEEEKSVADSIKAMVKTIADLGDRIEAAAKRKHLYALAALQSDCEGAQDVLKGLRISLEQTRAAIRASEAESAALVHSNRRAEESVYTLMGTCKGGHITGHPPTHLDWNTSGHVLRTCSAGAGEVRFWRVHTAGEAEAVKQGECVRIYASGPGSADGESWHTHTAPLGWAVSGLVDYGSGGAGWVSGLDRTPADLERKYAHCTAHESTGVMVVGDVGGRLMLMRYPRGHRSADATIVLGEGWGGDARVLTSSVENKVVALCDLLRVTRRRLAVHRTGPAAISVTVLPPDADEPDTRSAMHVLSLLMRLLDARGRIPAHTASESENPLEGVQGVLGPAVAPPGIHVGPIANVCFAPPGREKVYSGACGAVVSQGAMDAALCVWGVSDSGGGREGRAQKARVRVMKHLRQALQVVRLGEGGSIAGALEAILDAVSDWVEGRRDSGEGLINVR